MRRPFTEDVYKDTKFMTLKGFYEALQRDTGVEEDFFMFDYPVPENQKDYEQAVKVVKTFFPAAKNQRNHNMQELEELRKIVHDTSADND